jgi:hypothetical protein
MELTRNVSFFNPLIVSMGETIASEQFRLTQPTQRQEGEQ